MPRATRTAGRAPQPSVEPAPRRDRPVGRLRGRRLRAAQERPEWLTWRLWWLARLTHLLRVCCQALGLLAVASLIGAGSGLPVVGIVAFVALGLALYLVPTGVERAYFHG
jgi:hypothetical protein